MRSEPPSVREVGLPARREAREAAGEEPGPEAEQTACCHEQKSAPQVARRLGTRPALPGGPAAARGPGAAEFKRLASCPATPSSFQFTGVA